MALFATIQILYLIALVFRLAAPLDAFTVRNNDGIHLAVHPVCGKLDGNVTDVNAGLVLSSYKTIVAFGVGGLPIVIQFLNGNAAL